ncbi:unnamed protein product [Kuraishia capsulata CBS 1993]|uniref:Protein CASP n=1 Tax=Kuraishia capsulata CBS 1993 TaxID=1382522 RepID=W6MHT9_9ASCO|nr:uncharacterized protein KUCA_T00001546001 [Kuraishia capsulata CBS 1993]CDK25576.1 unnamed protein product [Kuraishia capsulata CBS 1993]
MSLAVPQIKSPGGARPTTPLARVGSPAPGGSSSFEKALNSWTLIDLPSLQKKMDTNALEIEEFQSQSVVNRKDLAAKTKSFKKLEEPEKLSQINPLLKAYQKEIDNLTKKNKEIENIFYQVYKSVAEAPDPKPLLGVSLDAINKVPELDRLKEEKQSLEQRLLNFADYDQLRSKLEKIEKSLKEQADSRVRAKEEEWKALVDEKQRNWNQKQKESDKTLSKYKKDLEDLKVSGEVMKLKLESQKRTLNDDSGLGEESSSGATLKTASSMIELEMISRDAETLKVRVLELEKRNEDLRRDLSIAQSDVEKDKAKELSNKRISELESETALLVGRLEQERRTAESLKSATSSKIESLTREVENLQTELKRLHENSLKMVDYDEIKKELEIIKSVQFGGSIDEIGDESGTLDTIVLQRNKQLTEDLVALRQNQETLDKKCKLLEDRLGESSTEIQRLRELNFKLETDLSSVQQHSSDNWEAMSMISSVSRAPSIRGRVSPASSIAGGFSGEGLEQQQQQDSSILPIITQQRDRFRLRNKELEDETKKQFSKIVELKREITSLKNDNRELYERIRFLQSFENSRNRTTAASSSEPEERYRNTYEQGLHPIEQFRMAESKRISSKMSPFERIFVSVTRTVLSTKLTRLLFVTYCIGLHFLVFLFMVYFTSPSSEVGGGFSDVSKVVGEAASNAHNLVDVHDAIAGGGSVVNEGSVPID